MTFPPNLGSIRHMRVRCGANLKQGVPKAFRCMPATLTGEVRLVRSVLHDLPRCQPMPDQPNSELHHIYCYPLKQA